MKKGKKIDKLFIRTAEYSFEDCFGNLIVARVDYSGNKYVFTKLKTVDGNFKLLEAESIKVILDLLTRKSKVNFA